MAAGQTFSLTETATLLGIHRNTLSKWIGQGCPVVQKADRNRGQEWQLALPEVVAWREQRAVEQAVGDTSKLDIEEARRRKTAAEAALAELELAKKRGEVVAIEVVAQVVGDQLSSCRARLLAIPTKAAPLVSVETDMNACRDILDAVVREALDELVGFDGPGAAGSGSGGYVASDDEGEDEAPATPDGERVGRRVQKAQSRGKRRARSVGDGEE